MKMASGRLARFGSDGADGIRWISFVLLMCNVKSDSRRETFHLTPQIPSICFVCLFFHKGSQHNTSKGFFSTVDVGK